MPKYFYIVLFFVSVVLLRLVWLYGNNPAAACDPDDSRCLPEGAKLFSALQTQGLLLREGNGAAVLPPASALLEPQWQGQTLTDKQLDLLEQLYGSAEGIVLRREARLWNSSRRLTALRHRFDAEKTAAALSWQVSDCLNGLPLVAHRRVSEDYGFVHEGSLRTGYSEWSAVRAEDDCQRWQTRLVKKTVARPQTLQLQLIGQPIDADTAHWRAIEVPERVLGKRARRCMPPSDKPEVFTARFDDWQRDDHAQGWVMDIALQLRPAVVNTDRESGLSVYLNSEEQCQLAWRPVPRPDSSSNNPQIVSADGELLYQGGEPTDLAQSLGLVPLVGYGKQDSRSLAGVLHANALSAQDYKVVLSLDSRHQAAAQQSLTEFITDKLSVLAYQDQRRAAFITLDVDTGDILSLAGWPLPPPKSDVTDWDLAAFSRTYPLDDPLQVWALEGSGYHFAPGSTFKPVTATALALAAKQETGRVKPLTELFATPGGGRFTEITGLSPGQNRYRPYLEVNNPLFEPFTRCPGPQCLRLHNHERAPVSEVAKRLIKDGCTAPAREAGHYGLVPALASSNNLWFARAATLIDGDAINQYDVTYKKLYDREGRNAVPPVMPPLYLDQAAQLLGVGPRAEAVDLFAGAPQEWQYMHRLKVPSGEMDLFPVALVGEPLPSLYPARWQLTQTAIGQAMNLPPVHQARMAMRIASGQKLQPRLVKSWHGEQLADQPVEELDVDLNVLRRSMKAVAETGTAASALRAAMPELNCTIRGKTGTAEIKPPRPSGSRRTFNSGWFVGWNEPDTAGERRIGFACMVSHIYGAYPFGGKTCGAIVADYFKRLQQEGVQ